jgi:hypothetical protein
MRSPFVEKLSSSDPRQQSHSRVQEMTTTSSQGCTESPSFFSEKCSRCRFACLNAPGQSYMDFDGSKSRRGLSLPGAGAVIAGAAVSFAGYPAASAGLTILGAVAIIANFVRE